MEKNDFQQFYCFKFLIIPQFFNYKNMREHFNKTSVLQ